MKKKIEVDAKYYELYNNFWNNILFNTLDNNSNIF